MKIRLLTVLSSALLMLASGCVPEELLLRRDLEKDTAVAIAAILPLTGGNKRYGEKMLEGLKQYFVCTRTKKKGERCH